MTQQIKPYKNSEKSKKAQVEEMFDTISGNYDNLNRMMTFGKDVGWRKKLVQAVADTHPDKILDIATGTGDLVLMMAKATQAQKIIGLDLSEGMLAVGRKKVEDLHLSDRIEMVQGDSENLPFDDNEFDAITVSFGIRNFENLEKGLAEIRRVLKPGGLFIILESSVPTKFPFKQGYFVYTKTVVPLMGTLFSKDKKAYNYLSESMKKFPFGEALNQILRGVGFNEVKHNPQTMGVATIYSAKK